MNHTIVCQKKSRTEIILEQNDIHVCIGDIVRVENSSSLTIKCNTKIQQLSQQQTYVLTSKDAQSRTDNRGSTEHNLLRSGINKYYGIGGSLLIRWLGRLF